MYQTLTTDKVMSVRRLQLDVISGKLISAPKKSLFLAGPIPLDWLHKAAELPGKSLNAALAIWWLNGMAKGKPLKLTRLSLKSFCVKREAASAALNRLEMAGLIHLQRSHGQRPMISILPCASAIDASAVSSITPSGLRT
jgi:hypothetical protein